MTQTGVYVGNDPSALTSYASFMGRSPDNVLFYLNNDTWSAFDSSISWAVNLWKPTNVPVIWSVPLTVWGTSLEQVATGAYDSHFRKAALALAQSKPSADGAIYVRVGWEFNGTWMPWSAQGHEAAFIQSFRHLVKTFRAVSNKFKFVFDVNKGGDYNPARAYPGDAYVDVIGMDAYYSKEWDSSDPVAAFQSHVWQSYGLQWLADFAASHKKPTAISEWGIQTDNAGPYIQAMTQWMRDHRMVYENYWNSDMAGYDGRISNWQYPHAAAAYLSAVGALQTTSAALVAPSTVSVDSLGGLVSSPDQIVKGHADLSLEGATLHLFDGQTEIGTAVVGSDGLWSGLVHLLEQDGLHLVSAKTPGGATSASLSYTLDTVSPELTATASLAGRTRKTTAVITASPVDATAGVATVTVYDKGTKLGLATKVSNGTWTFTATDLADGIHRFSAIATDKAGHASLAVRTGGDIVVDTRAPKVTLTDAWRTKVGTAFVTSLAGKAEPGSLVSIVDNGKLLGRAHADASGHWTLESKSVNPWTTHVFTAVARDDAGNVSVRTPKLVLGSSGADTVTNESYGTRFVSTTGADKLIGGGAREKFIFHAGSGKDAIFEFTPGTSALKAHDTLVFDHRIAGLKTLSSDAELYSYLMHRTTQTASGALIKLTSVDTILLHDVKKAQLAVYDFDLI